MHSCVCNHVQMPPVARLATSIWSSRTIPVGNVLIALPVCRNGLGSSVCYAVLDLRAAMYGLCSSFALCKYVV